MAKLRMNQAIAAALADEMRADPDVVVFGEDVAVAGGPFKTSEGLLEEFGPKRVRDTPISEMAFLGTALGAAATGLKPVAEIMFVEFLGVALDQLVTEAAKFHFLSGGQIRAPMVVRASVGAGLGFGCQHSQTLETWLMGSAGLKVAVASGARSAYGILRSAIRDPNPVILLEPRTLYGQREEFEPSDEGLLPLGEAEVLMDGEDLTIVALGQMVRTALAAAESTDGWSAEIIDLRTLVPWDRGRIIDSVRRTGHLVLIEENPYTGGWGAQIAAYVAGHAFDALRAPVLRITAPDVPVPFNKSLEARYVPQPEYVVEQVDELLHNQNHPAPWWEKEGLTT